MDVSPPFGRRWVEGLKIDADISPRDIQRLVEGMKVDGGIDDTSSAHPHRCVDEPKAACDRPNVY